MLLATQRKAKGLFRLLLEKDTTDQIKPSIIKVRLLVMPSSQVDPDWIRLKLHYRITQISHSPWIQMLLLLCKDQAE